MNGTQAQYEAVNRYKKKNYDTIQLNVPKGERERLKEFCSYNGVSVNALLNEFIIATLDGKPEADLILIHAKERKTEK